ncbi:zinc finger FYVE domain-containing protein 26-like [Lingula anatina]|nr:zinc finger FYVE domain-containing protein 26-like [Lingula anatina]|eukprot:XP_013400771.1 zinc finger FYVE domain-containing protein 26-like [Lingula anatina]
MLQQRLRDRLSGSAGRMSASPARISVLSRTPENIIEEDNEDDEADINKTVTDQQQQSEFFWQLTQDQTHNKNLREDFYYEHAPSLPLCLSILALHSDAKECGQLLLNLCDNVSKLLAVKNHAEVDYGLVISMMKYLLFNAKMKFLSCGNSNGIAQCEMYSGRVEMLNLLVASHCKHIPSLQKLTQLETVRRLRDKLIEDERLSLAMEISTKCGLDPAGVWAAWGKACLKTGDFQAAREKFSRCMKAPVDKNQYQQSSNLLNDIVECIENLPGSGINTIQALQASLKSISSLIAEPFVVQNEETNISEQQLQECLYYLKAYGTYGSVISFYRKHGYWMKAVQYLLDKRCSPDVFVECLLVPTLKTGEMAKLQDQLILIDTTLEKWAPYLKAACRYLNKKKYMQVLYQLQLFMKDYVRAAMTCISYSFQHGAVSYGDLYNRLSYIQDAKQHLEDYLEQKLWLVGLKGPAGRRVPDWGGSGGDTLRLLQPPKEVNRYINTISLQVEVTKFLHQYYNAGAAAGELMFPPGKIPTLFGNNNVKVDVVNMVMVAGKNINDGFGIAFRIIQEFQLNATLVYTTVARQLSKQKKFISVKQLLGCIQESGLCDDQSYDEVIGACIRVMADDATEAKEAESLIKLIKSQANKINAYILCGKLKSAYLIAVKEERVEDVQRISGAALRAGQPAVKNICDKWLQQRLKPKK